MTISARAALMAGVATVTASAVLVAPSVQPLPPPKPTIQLAADSSALQPSDPISDYIAQLNAYFPQLIDAAGQQLSDPATFLSDWAERILTPPSFGTAPPPPPPVVIPTPGSIASSLEGAYHAIEPWVQWGFELAAYGVGFIPWFGWLAPQITIFYHFGEGIVHAIAHNTLDWLDGDGTFWQNVGDGVNETINAFIYLANAQIDFWLPSLPPLPPLPCIFRCNLAATTLMGPTTTPLGEFAPAGELLDRVTAPVRNGIGFGAGLLRDTFDRIPLVSDIAGQSVPGAVEATEDVGETAARRTDQDPRQSGRSVGQGTGNRCQGCGSGTG